MNPPAHTAVALAATHLFRLQQLLQGASAIHACACSRKKRTNGFITTDANDPTDIALRDLLARVEAAAGSDDPERAIIEVIETSLDGEDKPQVKVALQGYHRVNDGLAIVGGSAIVEVAGDSVVLVVGAPKIRARGNAVIYATNSASLTLYENVFADLSGEVTVRSYDSVRGLARGSVSGVARGKSRWTVSGHAHFDTHDNAMAEGYEFADMRGYGSSRICGRNSVKAQLFDSTNGWFADEADVVAAGSSIVYPAQRVHVRRVGVAARVIPLPANQPLEVF